MLSAIVLALVVSVHCETPGNVHALFEDLLNDKVYNKMIRGEPDLSEATLVRVKFSLLSINKFDEVGEELEVRGDLYLSWRDARLAWNPENYNQTQSIHVAIENVWMPTIVLYNPSTEMKFPDQYNTMVRYDHDGNARWSIADVFKVKCPAAVTSFPFDRQTCGLHFSAYGYTRQEIRLINTKDEIISNSYVKNGLWLLSKTYVQEDVSPYRQYLKFIIEFDRYSTFYFINICVPAFVLGLLSVFAMMIPQESGERISYSITVLLSIAIFLNVTSDYLPANSVNMASICYFLLAQLAASSVTCVCSIVSLNMYFRKSKTPPQWMTKLVSRLTCRASCRQTRSIKMMLSKPGTVGDETQHTEQDQEHVSENHGDVTWQDISQLFDSVCLVILLAFLVVTVISYALEVTRDRDQQAL